jgi:hypothetical protein
MPPDGGYNANNASLVPDAPVANFTETAPYYSQPLYSPRVVIIP